MAKLKKTRKVFDKSDFAPVSQEHSPQKSQIETTYDKTSRIVAAGNLSSFLFQNLSTENKIDLIPKLVQSFSQAEEYNDSWLKMHFDTLFSGALKEVILKTVETKGKEIKDFEEIKALMIAEHRNLLLKIEALFSEKNIEEHKPLEPNSEESLSLSNIEKEGTNDFEDELSQLLLAYHQNLQEEEIKDFHTVIKEHWKIVRSLLEQDYIEELDLVKELDRALRNFLKDIEKTFLASRKPVLIWLADLCNRELKAFEFVSPEAYVKVEPNYHNVINKIGARIKAGLSYLVVRKSNKQVVFKADVKTN